MESGPHVRGKMFIDATYEGDLMAKAGVSYHVGREANATYGETLNGVQLGHASTISSSEAVDPYVKPGDPDERPAARRPRRRPRASTATATRACRPTTSACALTDVPENRVPLPKPAGYDPLRYELLLRNFEAGRLRRASATRSPMPNRKTDTNNNGAFSTDNIGMNYDYPDGDYATRDEDLRGARRPTSRG